MSKQARRLLGAATLAVALLAVGACSDAGTGPGDLPGLVEGVDLDALFAPPTGAEIERVLAEWSARRPHAVGATIVFADTVELGGLDTEVRVFSHLVDGVPHVGAVLAPLGLAPASAPVIVYGHGGEEGVRLEEVLLVASALDDPADELVWVIPTFRSEALTFGDERWLSGGAPSLWDGDVDDALALLEVALETTPAADPERVGAIGVSRGAGVALLLGVRDARFDFIVEFFGPADFFDGYVRDIVEQSLRGSPPDLPGVAFLSGTYLDPLREGTVPLETVRLELLRRSAVYFAGRLPAVQLHHGTADAVVDVSQAERLMEAMAALGRGEPEFEAFVYQGGRHDPFSLAGAASRTAEFLARNVSSGTP